MGEVLKLFGIIILTSAIVGGAVEAGKYLHQHNAQVVEHSTPPDEVKVIRLIDGTQDEINAELAKYPEWDFGTFTHRIGISPTLYLHRRK